METQKKEQVKEDGLLSRRAAFAVLNDIFFKKRSLDEAVAHATGFENLAARDRAFVRLLVATVLKRARQMDAVLKGLLHEQLKPANLINIFRLGMAQFAFLETPAHAAVNTTVELAEAEGFIHQKDFVNAVMRRLAREGFPHKEPRDAGKEALPDWLWREWMQDYGVETALDIAASLFDEAGLDITVKSHPEEWAKKLEAKVLPTGSLRRTAGGFIPDLPGFADGEWWIQNAAAALPAKLFGDMKGKTVVDLCAAPGGKTAQLASMGARVIAVDRSAERMMRLRENMMRLKLDVETVVADAAVWMPREPVDAVLLDAPCTATGTLRHQPDVLHLKEPKDQEKLASLQRRLLQNAVLMLKPQGILVYCTCSLQKAEGEHQVEWLLEQGFPVREFPVSPGELPGISGMVTEEGDIRALPIQGKVFNGIDGFFIARFVRI